MSSLTAVGHSPLIPTANSAPAPEQRTGVNTQRPAPVPEGDDVSLSSQALTANVTGTGHATLNAARDFIHSVATSLFGEGTKVEFGSADLEASAQFEAAVVHDANVDGAGISLDQSAHFVGSGEIVTADGEKYTFEIEVQYQAHAEALAAQSNAPASQAPDLAALTGRALPAVHFPGGLDDLFRLLGRDLQATLQSKTEGGGNLTMRLLHLVNTAALLAPRAQQTEAQAKAAAENYSAAAEKPAPPQPQLAEA